MCNSFSDFCEVAYLKKSEKILVSTCFKKPGFPFFIYINRAKQTKEIFIYTFAGTDKANTCVGTLLELEQLNFSFLLSGQGKGGRGVLSEIRNFDRKYFLNAPIQKKNWALLVMLLSFFTHKSCLNYPGIYT